MEKVGRNPRRRVYGARDKEEIIKTVKRLYNKGHSLVDIARITGVNRGTLSRWNNDLQFIKMRTPGEAGKLKSKIYDYDEDYFENINTFNKAYLLGYIAGDGTIRDDIKRKRLILTLAEQDKQLLDDIAKELQMEKLVKFRKRNAENEQNKYSLVINCTKMCDDLIKLNVTPRKTGNEKWVDLGDQRLQWSFLRGFFDADGSIRVYTRYGYTKARMGFTGNKEFLTDILQFLKIQGFAKGVNAISPKQGCYDLYLSSVKDLKKIFPLLYRDGDIKLNRKYDIFSSLMI
ncbi:LAGLIDADG family homing endonuclease [Atopococcus tabaci]|uniref:LAGLIDADG family homing endonuclease n=1 Tax=Atopococcus tabaci TaxID=269774 RepID=UPI0003FFCBAF|nr:LAGLIDADG family homing endonuclease [Atopococcus tabaci]